MDAVWLICLFRCLLAVCWLLFSFTLDCLIVILFVWIVILLLIVLFVFLLFIGVLIVPLVLGFDDCMVGLIAVCFLLLVVVCRLSCLLLDSMVCLMLKFWFCGLWRGILWLCVVGFVGFV